MKSRCYCLRCDYDLAATVSGPCPECGTIFKHNDPATFSIVPRHTLSYRLRRWKWYALLLAIILLWPGGWTLMITRWSATGSTATIDGKAFAIGRPWWLGGFWPPITWNSPQTSPAEFVPPPIGENVPLYLDGKATVSYSSPGGPNNYSLDANSAYFFTTGPVYTTSKADPGTVFSWFRSSSSQAAPCSPWMYQLDPLSATIMPYFFRALRITSD